MNGVNQKKLGQDGDRIKSVRGRSSLCDSVLPCFYVVWLFYNFVKGRIEMADKTFDIDRIVISYFNDSWRWAIFIEERDEEVAESDYEFATAQKAFDDCKKVKINFGD